MTEQITEHTGGKSARQDSVGLSQLDGVLVLNKPGGPTSTKCLNNIKHQLRQKKIGHAGTLDPMARGVLIVLLGQATKIAQHLLGSDKTYVGELEIGRATDTYDIEGQITDEPGWEGITEERVREEVLAWLELNSQIVPPYSAAKHKGQPLYKISRQGKEAPVKEKPVKIYRAEILEMDLPRVRFRVSCSTGTYIRSLVHSLGIRLGCGAVLTDLLREHSHPFSLDDAYSLEQLLSEPELLHERVLPLDKALPDWPRIQLSAEDSALVRNGARLDVQPAHLSGKTFLQGQPALFIDSTGCPLALVETTLADGRPVWGIQRGLWKS